MFRIYKFSILFKGKVNLVGALGRSKSHIPSSFQNRPIGNNTEKLRKTGHF